jgi:hypothetical protein
MPNVDLLNLFDTLGWYTLIIAVAIMLIAWQPANAIIRLTIKLRCIKRFGGTEGRERYAKLVESGSPIGIIERLIVLIFVFISQFEAIAWVMVAKGFIIQGLMGTRRSSTNKEEDDTSFMGEVYLIGTLLSFLIAIAGGIVLLVILGTMKVPGISG